jgi:transcriptional regulator with XRE-family HTH domain
MRQNMDAQAFGARIKARREELGLSQNDLAIALRIPQGKVSMIEKGTRKVEVLTELPALAEVLKCPITWFFGSTDLPIDGLAIQTLLKEWTPNVEYTEDELKQINSFMSGVIKSYLESLHASEKKRERG